MNVKELSDWLNVKELSDWLMNVKELSDWLINVTLLIAFFKYIAVVHIMLT